MEDAAGATPPAPEAGPAAPGEGASNRLDADQPAGKPVVLSFINLKGGVGKTTTAIAVAEILAHDHGRRVLLIDLDPQTNATVTLIPEQRWAEMDRAGQTVAQLFEDYLNPQYPKRFDIETAIARRVSTIANGIEGLDLLPSSIRLIDIQERIPLIAVAGHFTLNPLDVLQAALRPVLARYDYVIIDCPPSLGTVTKNGLRISTGYVIPTIPDTLSTWGIYQIVDNVERFARETSIAISAIGVVATKVQGNNLHTRVIEDMKASRLGRFGEGGRLKQPPMFDTVIPQSVAVARAADILAGLRTLRLKYGDAYTQLTALTQEIIERCETKAP
jgi:chromosome partitioning protein